MLLIPDGYKKCKGGPYNGQNILVESTPFQTLTFTAKGKTGYYSNKISSNTAYASACTHYVYWWDSDKMTDLTIYL